VARLRNSKRILDICDEAVAMTEGERRAYLDRVCANDLPMRDAVCSLLQAIEDSGSFLRISENA